MQMCPTTADCLEQVETLTQANIEQLREDSNKTVDYLVDLPSYAEFFSKYLLPNRPCVFSAKATETWRSRRDWVTSDGRPCVDFLHDKFGCDTVPVADCGQEEYSAQPKQDLKLSEYLQYWRDRGDNQSGDDRCLYLKDWHFTRSFPEYEAYSTPVYFRSDWLNEFWDSRQDGSDDYRFVYVGPKGSWTPFHADVFRSYSWSANVCGRKKWVLFPPGEEQCLTDVHGQLVYDIGSTALSDERQYPDYAKLQHKLEVFQEAGEIIFIPSGWHHQVYNLEDTISVNHNWMNGCNVDLCWAHVKRCLQDVQKEIADCQDMDGWHRQCQLILKASSGIDYREFLYFLLTIAQHRLHALGCKSEICVHNSHTMLQSTEQCLEVQPDVMENILRDKTVWSSCQCVMQSKVLDSGVHTTPQDKCALDSTSNSGGHKSESESNLNLSMLDLAAHCADNNCDQDKYENAHWRFCDTSHAKFDLARVRDILEDILSLQVLNEIDAQDEILRAKDVCCAINNILCKTQ